MKVIDGKKFECKKCGKCCKWNGKVLLNTDDVKRLAKHCSLKEVEFLNKYTDNDNFDRITLKDKPDSSECVFLRDNKCDVWDVKPKQCKDFPKKYEKKCPGFHTDDRSASMSDKYELAVKAVSQRLSNDGEFDKNVLNSVFSDLHKNIKSASIVSVASENGIDPFLDDNRVKVASLDDLFAFDRIGSNQLIHKCTKELWSIDADDGGNVQITRLFDNSGEPIKG